MTFDLQPCTHVAGVTDDDLADIARGAAAMARVQAVTCPGRDLHIVARRARDAFDDLRRELARSERGRTI